MEPICHFSHKSVLSITHEQNICSKTHVDGITHEQTIICRQIFAGHVVGSRPMKRKEKNASNDNKQLLDEVEHDIMNYQNRGLRYQRGSVNIHR